MIITHTDDTSFVIRPLPPKGMKWRIRRDFFQDIYTLALVKPTVKKTLFGGTKTKDVVIGSHPFFGFSFRPERMTSFAQYVLWGISPEAAAQAEALAKFQEDALRS